MTRKRSPAAPPPPPRNFWTAGQIAILRRDYPHRLTSRVAEAIGRSVRDCYAKAGHLGLRKTPEYMASTEAFNLRRGGDIGVAGRFAKGNTPWNKGKPGTTGRHPNTAAHHFGPGNRPHTWKPVGSLRINDDGYLQRKLTETGYSPRDWVTVHRIVWEAAHGPIPPGHVVVFRDGKIITDIERITPDVVECISRRENMLRNSVHTRLPKPLASLVQLRGALQRQINRRAAREAQAAEPPTDPQGNPR